MNLPEHNNNTPNSTKSWYKIEVRFGESLQFMRSFYRYKKSEAHALYNLFVNTKKIEAQVGNHKRKLWPITKEAVRVYIFTERNVTYAFYNGTSPDESRRQIEL